MPEPLAHAIVWLLSAIVVLWALLVVAWLADALWHTVARRRTQHDGAGQGSREQT